jgi:hypothetical protein
MMMCRDAPSKQGRGGNASVRVREAEGGHPGNRKPPSKKLTAAIRSKTPNVMLLRLDFANNRIA